MEQSESTASDSTQELSAEEVLDEIAKKCKYQNGSHLLDAVDLKVFWVLKAMEKYASQKDTQIQALTKEVDGLKGHIEHLESQIFTLESTEVDQISQLKISGNKMAEALRVSKEIVESNGYKWLSDESQQALEEWEKLNK